MAVEVQGKLVNILNPVTGEGRNGAWTKQEFILETFEQYPKKICISAWGEKIDQLKRFRIGDDVKASINIESRPSATGDRWFTEIRAWKLDPAGQAPQQFSAPTQQYAAPQYAAPAQNFQAPNQGTPQYTPPAPNTNFQAAEAPANSNFFSNEGEDDLPF